MESAAEINEADILVEYYSECDYKVKSYSGLINNKHTEIDGGSDRSMMIFTNISSDNSLNIDGSDGGLETAGTDGEIEEIEACLDSVLA